MQDQFRVIERSRQSVGRDAPPRYSSDFRHALARPKAAGIPCRQSGDHHQPCDAAFPIRFPRGAVRRGDPFRSGELARCGSGVSAHRTGRPGMQSGPQAQTFVCEAVDLTKVSLLHLASRPDAWERWFSMNGGCGKGASSMVFDQFATVAQATMSGVGVSLLPAFLIQEELASGRLVPALDLPMESLQHFYLVWPAARATHPPLVAVRDWLVAEAASTDRAERFAATPPGNAPRNAPAVEQMARCDSQRNEAATASRAMKDAPAPMGQATAAALLRSSA